MKAELVKFFVIAVVATAGIGAVNGQWVIQSSAGLFTPSFRGAEDSAWFGWGAGQFFSDPALGGKRRLLNPAPTSGNVGLADGVTFYQLNWTDTTAEVIGSSTNNIHKGGAGAGVKPPLSLSLGAPTLGTNGQGFKTIIIQGISLTSGSFGGAEAYLINQPIFGDINGVSPEFVMGINSDNRAQFWVKYDLIGNQTLYDIPILLPTTQNQAPVSIAGLTVDSYWSETGFASDFAVIPEPSTWLLIGVGIALVLFSQRRRVRNASSLSSTKEIQSKSL
jgi:hypothetical protein